MTEHSPITPPPKLVQEWIAEAPQKLFPQPTQTYHYIAEQAAQWGADQELEACCEWLVSEPWFKYELEAVEDLRAARRPKPPSLKEQGLQALDALQQRTTDPNIVEPLRRALEALPND